MLIHSPGNQTLYLSISARGYDPLLFARAFNLPGRYTYVSMYLFASQCSMRNLLVYASLLNFTQFTLFNSSDTATSPVEIPLDGTTTSPDGTEIVIQLPPDLALMIKTTADIATSISDTFIDYQMGLLWTFLKTRFLLPQQECRHQMLCQV